MLFSPPKRNAKCGVKVRNQDITARQVCRCYNPFHNTFQASFLLKKMTEYDATHLK
jgi:hypothetical protein